MFEVARLRTVLDEKVDIHGRGNFPTISVRLLDLIIRVRHKLRQAEMPPKCVKLNGGAASFVASADAFPYADIDLIFPMESGDADSFDKVRLVGNCLPQTNDLLGSRRGFRHDCGDASGRDEQDKNECRHAQGHLHQEDGQGKHILDD